MSTESQRDQARKIRESFIDLGGVPQSLQRLLAAVQDGTEEPGTAEQVLFWAKAVMAKSDASMTATQLHTALRKAGMTQVDFAKMIGVNDLTVRHWVSGWLPVPTYVALILDGPRVAEMAPKAERVQ